VTEQQVIDGWRNRSFRVLIAARVLALDACHRSAHDFAINAN
jgi:hypothetical protein